MGWILFGLFLVFAVGRGVGHAGKSKDDFSGNGMESFFLLDEFIDTPDAEDDALGQDGSYLEQEDDWFEDEWE